MKLRWAWKLAALAILSMVPVALAQGPGGMAGPAMYPPPGAMGGPPPGMYGPPGMMPAGYAQGGPEAYGPMMPGGMGGAPPMDMAVPAGCPQCGGAGCEACGGGGRPHGLANGLLGDVLGCIAPYPDGGCAAPRWFDFSLEFMQLRREDPGRNTQFTSLGLGGPDTGAPIVLQTDNLDFDLESGFRFTALGQIGPASSVEFTFYGLFFYDDQQTVFSANNDLYSVVSDFGQLPAGGFAETDESDLQSIRYKSQFDNFEVNYRQRWQAPNCRYQGSWLAGIRYFKLKEDFNYLTQSTANGTVLNPRNAQFYTNSHNNLIGGQIGGDMWICLIPGLRMGGEAKFGVYGNHYNVDNTIRADSTDQVFLEELSTSDVAFIGQADLMATYRINYQWTLKVGYQFLYVDGVALASEQFNTTPPALVFPTAPNAREPFTNDNGRLFYHGYSVGAEFCW
ncbi:MAG: BBP7 family outer membrane beta-barrel protein [Pirellulaceae bacterium]|nr:BBP7 family outer membrane beta-barrel protein [Pirellulaceae bacterium]